MSRLSSCSRFFRAKRDRWGLNQNWFTSTFQDVLARWIADSDIDSEGKFSLEIFFEFFGSELPARSFPRHKEPDDPFGCLSFKYELINPSIDRPF